MSLIFYVKNYNVDGPDHAGLPVNIACQTLDEALDAYRIFSSRGPAVLGTSLDGEWTPLVLHRRVLPDDTFREHMLAADTWRDADGLGAVIAQLCAELPMTRMVSDGRIVNLPPSGRLPAFFEDKALDTSGGFPFFERVYVVGWGWLDPVGYEKTTPWESGCLPYVDRYHIRCVRADGQTMEADVPPLVYDLLLERLDPAELGTWEDEEDEEDTEDEDTSD